MAKAQSCPISLLIKYSDGESGCLTDLPISNVVDKSWGNQIKEIVSTAKFYSIATSKVCSISSVATTENALLINQIETGVLSRCPSGCDCSILVRNGQVLLPKKLAMDLGLANSSNFTRVDANSNLTGNIAPQVGRAKSESCSYANSLQTTTGQICLTDYPIANAQIPQWGKTLGALVKNIPNWALSVSASSGETCQRYVGFAALNSVGLSVLMTSAMNRLAEECPKGCTCKVAVKDGRVLEESLFSSWQNYANDVSVNRESERDRLLQEAKSREQERLVQEAQLRNQERLAQDAKLREQERLAQEAKLQEQERIAQQIKLREQEQLLQASRARDEENKQLKAELARLQEQARKTTESLTSTPVANRKALVIGNDNYKNVSKLLNAREDAKVIAQNLERVGYKVLLRLDLSERDMKSVMRTFKNMVEAGDEVAIFYAGHGVQIGAVNYLLPTDVGSDSEDQVRDEAIPLQRVLDDMSEKKAKFTLAIMDACRDNPFKSVVTGRNIGSGVRGLAATSAATGQMIVFSAGQGQQALDRLGEKDMARNGLFTRIFVQEMLKPDTPIDRVVKNVRNEVSSLAKSIGHDQVPAIYDQVLGDFYFLRNKAP